MKFSDTLFNALNKIAEKTKMDCWFWIEDKGDEDVIKDLENDSYMSLEDGIEQLSEGIVEPISSYGLTEQECIEIMSLFKTLQIPTENN